jgi:hypothetical protein
MADQIASLFAVPTHTLGAPVPARSRRERAMRELAETQSFEANYPGVLLERSAAASELELVERFPGLPRPNLAGI